MFAPPPAIGARLGRVRGTRRLARRLWRGQLCGGGVSARASPAARNIDEHFPPSQPVNEAGDENLATGAHGAVRLVRATYRDNAAVMNDAIRVGSDEDSFNGDSKQEDFWGYTWPRVQRINTLRYTTGRQTANGGFFEQLRVQIRNGTVWQDVPIKSVVPAYPGSADTPPFTTYTLRFDTVVSDGVRVYGKPGGSFHYTSIAELSVHFE